MTIKQSRDFEVNSANLKEVRAYAREVLSNVPEIESTKDDVILALAEAAQNIVKHAYNGDASKDTMRVDITYENKILTFDLYDKGKPVIPLASQSSLLLLKPSFAHSTKFNFSAASFPNISF